MNSKIKRAFLDTEDGQIHYRVGGEGEPLLLLQLVAGFLTSDPQ